MKSAVLSAPHEFRVVDEPIPSIEPDEVLVRVAYCGVCTSELDVWTGKAGTDSFPRALGHEVSGVIERVGDEVTGVQGPLLLLGDVTRMSGKVVLVGYHQGGMRQIPLAHWNYQAYEIVNAHFREQSTIMRGMQIGMKLLTHGRLSLDGLVTHRFPLDAIADAFATAEEKPEGFVKSTVGVGA